MEGFELIKQGAEAKLYTGIYLGKPAIVKERFVKKYRHPDLDKKITQDRIKAEARIISRCQSTGMLTPTLYLVDLKRRLIVMQYFENSITIKDFFCQNDNGSILKKVSQNIGLVLSKMHFHNIIHGDLTTSNMLLVKKDTSKGFTETNVELAMIDFGLAHMDSSTEDKAVDLYVLERALISTHNNADEIFPTILDSYMRVCPKVTSVVLKKYEEVRARGRKRTMVG